MKFKGIVRQGNKRGEGLGFSTANVNLSKKIPDGIYISKLKLEGKEYPAITFIGKSKTFNEQKYQAETYILDFNENIYDKWISVKLLKKIRKNMKFNTASELILQMKKDEKMVRSYFS